jgi:hypothetical protein
MMHSPIKPPNYFRLIKEALDRNIICYDRKSEYLTKRLISITKEQAVIAGIAPDILFVGDQARHDFAECTTENPSRFMGMDVRYIKGLDVGDEHTKYLDYYYYLGGSMARAYDYTPHPKKYLDILKDLENWEYKQWQTLNNHEYIAKKLRDLSWNNDHESLILIGTEEKVMMGCY